MFTRQWLRAALGAGGVVLVVPIGLMLAAVLAVAVGGSSLGGLGQVLDGPQVPRGQAVSAGADGDRATAFALPRAPRARPPGSAPRGATTAGARPGGDDRVRAPRNAPRPSEAPTTNPAPGPAPAAGPSPSPAPAAPAAPALPAAPVTPPSAAAPQGPIRGLAKALDDTLRPIAPPVADAVGSVVDLVVPPR